MIYHSIVLATFGCYAVPRRPPHPALPLHGGPSCLVLPWLFLAWKKNYFPWRPVWLVSCAFFLRIYPANSAGHRTANAPTARSPRARSAARRRPPRPRRCRLSRRSYLRVLARERRAARLAGARRAHVHRRAPRAHRRAHRGGGAARQPLSLGVLCLLGDAHGHARAQHERPADERVGGRVHERHLVERDHVAEHCGEQPLRVDHVVHRHLLLRRAERNVREQRSSRYDCRAARAALA